MIVERMTKSDIDGLVQLEKECFSAPWSENSLLEELDNDTARFFVAKDKNEIIGYIGANNVCGDVFITNVAVSKGQRNKGIATALLNKLIQEVKKDNAEYITLEVRESNESAKALYKKMGFKEVGNRKNFYDNPSENAILYTLFLR